MIKKYLAKKTRDALLFSFGINTGLRISDILSLDVGNVKGQDYIEIREKKRIIIRNSRLIGF